MALSTDLLVLWWDIYNRGENTVAEDALAEYGQVVDTLKFALRDRVKTDQPFKLQFQIVPQNTCWCLHFDGTTAEVIDSCCEGPDNCVLTGGLAQIMYIIAGTQLDTIPYRAQIMVWWQKGVITVGGDQQLMQRIQGFFR